MIDHVALAPAYAAAGTALLAFLTDLIVGRRGAVLTVTALGAAATVAAALWVPGPRTSFCGAAGCSYVWDDFAAVVGVTVAVAAFVAVLLCAPLLRAGVAPSGELCFLIGAAMTGGVVLGASRDLITLIVAIETLTLPLYAAVALRRRELASAQAAVTFFTVSVVSTAVTLLGAALLYAVTGTVHLNRLAAALTGGDAGPTQEQLQAAARVRLLAEAGTTEVVAVPAQPAASLPPGMAALAAAAVALVLVGLAFKVAAVPLHAWAPATYDGAPLPVAAFLSTASKAGGVAAILLVVVVGLGPQLAVAGPILAALAVVTMTVGNLVALRQQRMVRLLAWSSIAQAGYILAPLGVFALADGRSPDALRGAVMASLAYAVLFVLLELGAFAAVVALRGAADGGDLDDYRGAARRRPFVAGAFVLAMAGLAGLPPGLAGLFAKVTVVRSLLEGASGWLALVVALNAVVGAAYYVRASLALFRSPEGADEAPWPRVAWPVAVALVLVTIGAVVVGFAPQLVLSAVDLVIVG
ncbi:NADH-quinone oxidoreductase subunit N [Luedemannella flava]|uniref:NADH-quinone oxidoreductase subunit N n=1 Tax=Luedemannella flava TaxID=349316 RepID=A0ABP4YZQ6_9ACTN